ncbi:MAG TPA: MFS transporter [Streptosporangiaceae bacterium]|jgi:EmrB/QacA subfamily drug resistance transporter|nr:MFS transporter [Streptosporangiaceae bacterium]
MSTSSIMQETIRPPSRRAALRDRRGLALAIVLGAQLMIILDMTVVNIALPSIAHGLHFSTTGLSWVLNAYTLTFGGLLLLGGRAGDILGRRRMFLVGITVFTAASLAGGLAQTAGWLLAARAAQGVGGAIASPAVLAMITASFADGRERARALGIYTAVVMGGGSLGLVLGGVITEWVSWRWVLFVNVPIGVAVALATPLFLRESVRQPGHFDAVGALTSTLGMASLVYGIIRAGADGWGNPVAQAAFAAAVVLLAGFVFRESRARQPITPLRLFADRRRAGSYLARLLIVAGMFGMFFFLTQFVQDILGFSPLRAGISFLPMTAALFGVSRLSPRLVSRFRPWTLMVAGMLPVVAGMAWLSRISPGTGYLAGVLGPMLLLGAGMGVVFVPLTMASLSGVRPEDSGAASSMVNVMQQVGGSLGLAVLVTAASSATGGAARLTTAAQAAVVHGMSSAFTLAALFDVLALVVVLTVMRDGPAEPGDTAG